MTTDATSSSFASPLTHELRERLRHFDGPALEVDPARTPTPPIELQVQLCGPDGAVVVLDREVVTIGRAAAGADLAVAEPTVSRRQVRVWRAGGATLCADLGSRNGTARRRDGELHPVPGHAAGPTLLLPGDELVTAQGALLAIVADASDRPDRP